MATRFFSTEQFEKPNIYVRFLCFGKKKKETCTVLRLISSIHTYTLTDSPVILTELREHRKHYGTAMRQHAGFTRVERSDARSRQIIASTNGRSAAIAPTRARTPLQADHDGAIVDRNKRVTPQKPLIRSGFPLRPYKMGSFRIGPYWLCLAFFSFDRHSPPPWNWLCSSQRRRVTPRPKLCTRTSTDALSNFNSSKDYAP